MGSLTGLKPIINHVEILIQTLKLTNFQYIGVGAGHIGYFKTSVGHPPMYKKPLCARASKDFKGILAQKARRNIITKNICFLLIFVVILGLF